VDKLITAQARQDIMDQQELTPDGRFPTTTDLSNMMGKTGGGMNFHMTLHLT